MTPLLFALIVFSVSLNALTQVTLRKAMLLGPLPPVTEFRQLTIALLAVAAAQAAA